MSNYPDPVNLEVGESAAVTFLKAITDLNGPGKPMGKWKKPGWITRVKQAGVEKTLFLDEGDRDFLLEGGVGPGVTFTITQTAPYKKAFEIEYDVNGAPKAAPASSGPTLVASPQQVSNGWTTSSFDNKLTPDLSSVPTLEGSAQSEIFSRAAGPVSTGLARRARRLVFEMANISPDDKVTAAQMASLAPAIQDTYTSLLIQWEKLGYPLTEWDAPYESGLADPDGDFD